MKSAFCLHHSERIVAEDGRRFNTAKIGDQWFWAFVYHPRFRRWLKGVLKYGI
jgi:hypothetical protein